MERYHLTRTLDTDGYELFIQEVAGHEPGLIPALTELDLLTYSEPTFSRYTLGAILRHGRVFLVYADDLLVGAAHLMRNWDDAEEAVLFNMALRPGWRGHGLGTRFLHGILDKLREQGTRSVALMVAASNHRAVAVYRSKFGFETVDAFPNEYNNGQEYLFMRKRLE
jgi:ribosomal-protein-alanine N-acetyltransferase